MALARAAYSGADIALLDDPLSAVDPRVGRILFGQCIGPGGVMQGAGHCLPLQQCMPQPLLPVCDITDMHECLIRLPSGCSLLLISAMQCFV